MGVRTRASVRSASRKARRRANASLPPSERVGFKQLGRRVGVLDPEQVEAGLVHPATADLYFDAAERCMHTYSAITNHAVHVLGGVSLSEEERQILTLGDNFVPTPTDCDLGPIVKSALEQFTRRCRLADYFTLYAYGACTCCPDVPHQHRDPLHPLSWAPRPSNSSWEPPQHSLAVELAYKSFGGWLEQQLEVAANPTSDPGDRTTNVPSSFRKLVSELRSRGVIARPADKNLGTCVLPLSWYRQMLWTHLSDVSTYVPVAGDPEELLRDWCARVKVSLTSLLGMSPAQVDVLLKDCRLPRFYCIYKLHKATQAKPYASRPITGACSSPTRVISDVLVQLLSPLTSGDGWTLKSSYEFVRHIESNTIQIPGSAYLLACDVESLYPNMDCERTIEWTIDRFKLYHRITADCEAVATLRQLLNMVLYDNLFEAPGASDDVDGGVFRQVSGIPMGVSVAVILANIYCGRALRPVFDAFHREGLGKVIYRRGYIDDVFGIVDCTAANLGVLCSRLNSACPGIKLTVDASLHQVTFLDVTVFKGMRWACSGCFLLDTKVYVKPLNAHLYIPYSSFHPRSALTGFISGEARRYICLCSNPFDALEQSRLFVQHLQARGYPLSVIIPQLCKVQYNRRLEYLKLEPGPDSGSGSVPVLGQRRLVPFILPYTPATQSWSVQSALVSHFGTLTPHLRPMVVWKNWKNMQQTLGIHWPRSRPQHPPVAT